MQGENNEDTMSLADVYAGIMGPDGLVKRCLGLENPDALGGMMSVGPNRKLLVLINGMEIGGEAS